MEKHRAGLWLALACGIASGCGGPEPMGTPDAGGGDAGVMDDASTIDAHIEGLQDGCVGLDLDEGGCLLPWPSSELLVDASTATGRRIELPEGGMPVNARGISVATSAWEARDGFSAMTSMIVRIEGQIDDEPLASWRQIDQTASDPNTSPTILLDTTTFDPMHPAVRVAHFAEVQTGADVDPAFTTLYVRPAARLEEGHHYVVAVRGLLHPDGTRPRSSVSFAALRDRTPTDSATLEARRGRFEDEVFAPLARFADRDTLIVAWDFWTGTDALDDLIAMRDQALAQSSSTICRLEDDAFQSASANAGALLVAGRFEVPNFLETDCGALWEGDIGSRLLPSSSELARDGNGVPTSRSRTCPVRFWALVPSTAATATELHLVQYGHGLSTSGAELDERGVLAPILERTSSIGISTDFLGLSDFGGDQETILAALQDVSSFDAVDHRIMQGLVAQLMLPHVFVHACAGLIADHYPGSFDPTNIVASPIRWVGNSEGGIFGPSVVALAPEDARFDRVAFGVGGISYPIMLPRSCDWVRRLPDPAHPAPAVLPSLDDILTSAYPRRIDRDLLMVMFASHWDLTEGATFAPRLAGTLPRLPGSASALPGILYQTAVNDLGTAEVAGEIAARTLGLAFLSEGAHTSATHPFALRPSGSGPTSAFVSFDYGGSSMPPPMPPDGPTTGDACAAGGDVNIDPHERVRRDPEAQDQIVGFFNSADGTIH